MDDVPRTDLQTGLPFTCGYPPPCEAFFCAARVFRTSPQDARPAGAVAPRQTAQVPGFQDRAIASPNLDRGGDTKLIVTSDMKQDKELWGECLSGALY